MSRPTNCEQSASAWGFPASCRSAGWFLTTSTACSTLEPPGLLHPGDGHGVRHVSRECPSLSVTPFLARQHRSGRSLCSRSADSYPSKNSTPRQPLAHHCASLPSCCHHTMPPRIPCRRLATSARRAAPKRVTHESGTDTSLTWHLTIDLAVQRLERFGPKALRRGSRQAPTGSPRHAEARCRTNRTPSASTDRRTGQHRRLGHSLPRAPCSSPRVALGRCEGGPRGEEIIHASTEVSASMCRDGVHHRDARTDVDPEGPSPRADPRADSPARPEGRADSSGTGREHHRVRRRSALACTPGRCRLMCCGLPGPKAEPTARYRRRVSLPARRPRRVPRLRSATGPPSPLRAGHPKATCLCATRCSPPLDVAGEGPASPPNQLSPIQPPDRSRGAETGRGGPESSMPKHRAPGERSERSQAPIAAVAS
jgi:hypothetical protein